MTKSTWFIATIVGLNLITSCGNLASSSQNSPNSTNPTPAKTELNTAQTAFNYQDYAEVLATYVDDQGLVDYVGLQKNRQQLDRFNLSLGQVTPETFESWPEAEQIAFLINAYNSFTLQSIIDQEPLKKSIRDIPGVWKRRKFLIAGAEKTLDNIEHDTLRKDYNEPRIHVALVCAAISCPPLRNEPFLPDSLDAQLNDQNLRFVNSPHGLSLDQENQRVYLSSIFKWYGQDYEETYGIKDKFQGNDKQKAVLNHFFPILDTESQEFLTKEDYKVKYLDYDWSLNQQN